MLLGRVRERGFASHPVVTTAKILQYLAAKRGATGWWQWRWAPAQLPASARRNQEGKKVLNRWKWSEHPLPG